MKSGLRHVRYVVCVFILQGLDPVFFLAKPRRAHMVVRLHIAKK